AFGLEEPVDATGFGAERVDIAALAADEDTAADDRGLGVGVGVAGKSERPFHLQPWYSSGRYAGRTALKPRVVVVLAPAVPGRSVERAGEGVLSHTQRRGRRRRRQIARRECLARDVLRDGTA